MFYEERVPSNPSNVKCQNALFFRNLFHFRLLTIAISLFFLSRENGSGFDFPQFVWFIHFINAVCVLIMQVTLLVFFYFFNCKN